jgi:tRNA modification GTPase
MEGEKEFGTEIGKTVAAIATPPGKGALAIIRMTGPASHAIFRKIFRTNGSVEGKERHLLYGFLVDPRTDKTLDEITAIQFKAPRSYTGEDMVEMFTHGGTFHVRNLFQLICREGARPAQPGEFSKRAFLNGKMDLTRAEAVEEIVSATDHHTHEAALRQLNGVFHAVLRGWHDSLMQMLSSLEAALEYPDETDGAVDRKGMAHRCRVIREEVMELLVQMSAGRVFKQKPKVVIAGKTNTGKSSLFNVLVGHERSIVSDESGTTRDVVSELAEIGGIPVELSDTAGRKVVASKTEEKAMEFTRRILGEADLILFLVDRSRTWEEEDEEMLGMIRASGRNSLVCLNKSDLPARLDEKSLVEKIGSIGLIHMSLTEGEGLDRLHEAVRETFVQEEIGAGPVVYSERYETLFRQMEQVLEKAQEGFLGNERYDKLLFLLKLALQSVEDFMGKVTGEDVLDRIFSRFCLGK